MFDLEEKLGPILEDYFGPGYEYEKDHILYFLESQGDRVLKVLKEEWEE